MAGQALRTIGVAFRNLDGYESTYFKFSFINDRSNLIR